MVRRVQGTDPWAQGGQAFRIAFLHSAGDGLQLLVGLVLCRLGLDVHAGLEGGSAGLSIDRVQLRGLVFVRLDVGLLAHYYV